MIKYFPTTIVDDFFENPKEIVKFANKQKFLQNNSGFFPGNRTQGIHLLDERLFTSVMAKLINIYFDFSVHTVYWENVEMYFQKIRPYSEDKQNLVNKGIIHQDGSFPLVGLIYLNEDPDLESGTSIFRPTKIYKNALETTKQFAKRKQNIYKKSKLSSSDLKDLEKLTKDVNYGFEETLKVNNVFNRLVAYNGLDFHGANNFMAKKDEERLTLVFFIHTIQASGFFPIQRMNNHKTNLTEDNSLNDSKKKSGKRRLN